MSISEKTKTIHNKIEQKKAEYNLGRQTAKISVLSSINVIKYEFLTGKDVLPEKDLLEKAVTMKRFEYSPLGNELNVQTVIVNKQYQQLNNTFEFGKIIKKQNYGKSNLRYDANHCYHDRKKFDNLSFKSSSNSFKSFLNKFFDDFDKLNNLNPQKASTKERKTNVDDKTSELYNDFLGIYFHKYFELSDDKRKKIESKYDPKDLFRNGYDVMCGQKMDKNRLVK